MTAHESTLHDHSARRGEPTGPAEHEFPLPGRVVELAKHHGADGYEIPMALIPGVYAGSLIFLETGKSTGLQFHAETDETIVVLSGDARVEHGRNARSLDGDEFGPGYTIRFTPGTVHRITAITDLVFTRMITAQPGWRDDVIAVDERRGPTAGSATRLDQAAVESEHDGGRAVAQMQFGEDPVDV